MKTFFTADLHFGHRRISQYSGRPFGELDHQVDEMNETIIKTWNDTVKNDDTIYILGDIFMGRRSQIGPIAERLNGTKLLIPGNHDSSHPMHKGHNREARRLSEFGIETLATNVPYKIGGIHFEMCHFPFSGNHGFEDRYTEWRPKNNGQWLLCGHVHDKWRFNNRQINVGIDAWGGSIISEEEILEAVKHGSWNETEERVPWLYSPVDD